MSFITINGIPAGGGGGIGNVISAAPVFTGSLVTTYTPTAGNVINTLIAGNSSDVSANTTFTISPVPAVGQTWVAWRLRETGGAARTIVIPNCISVAQGATIAGFTLNPYQVAEMRLCYDGANWYIFGEPATYGQLHYPFEVSSAASDEGTALTTGTSKVTFDIPYNVTLTNVYAGLNVAQTSGSIFTVDVNEGGVSILSTKLTVDNGETTSSTAATPCVISDPAIAAFAKVTVDIDQIGDGTAKGLKIWLVGYRTS